MSTTVLPDPPPESAANDEAAAAPAPPSWRARTSHRLDAFAALLRGTHEHRIPF